MKNIDLYITKVNGQQRFFPASQLPENEQPFCPDVIVCHENYDLCIMRLTPIPMHDLVAMAGTLIQEWGYLAYQEGTE